MTNRRTFLLGSVALGSLAACGAPQPAAGTADTADAKFEVTHTEDEWRKILPGDAYATLRHEATEAPGSSPLDAEERKGAYTCAGCDLPVFASETKFHSGTGWPSFWKPLDNAVATKVDASLGMERTEVHCRRC